MKRKSTFMLSCLCASVVLCACGSSGVQTKDPVNTQIQPVDSQDAKGTENTTESSEQLTETGEAKVLTFKPDASLNYRGKDLHLSLEEEGSIIKLEYGKAEYDIKEYAEWLSDGYIIEIDDTSFYTIIQGCSSNDWVTSYIVKYDGNSFAEVAYQNGGVEDTSCISGNQIIFDTRVDVFGTYGVKIPMKLENDQLTMVDDLIKFINEPDPEIYDTLKSPEGKAIYNKEGYSVLTLKRPLTAMSDDGNMDIQEGEQIIPYGYKEKEKKFYFTYGGKQYYFTYDVAEDGYTYSINGVNQEDMFVYLPYAG